MATQVPPRDDLTAEQRALLTADSTTLTAAQRRERAYALRLQRSLSPGPGR